MDIKFESVEDSDGTVRDKLLQLLIEENSRKVGEAQVERSIICIKNPDNGEVRGGIWAEILFDWMYIEILYVPEELRGEGIGLKLLKQAEEIAAVKSCVGIWLETFEFQAPDFYLKNGYEIFATLNDYPKGRQRIFLQKRINASSDL